MQMDIEGDNTDKKNNKHRVKVAIRARPMITKELASNEQSCIQVAAKQEIIIGNDRSFKFDRVFRQSSPQVEVYEQCIKDLIMGCFEGYNAAVLAYGQTGSGKTYTMGTNRTTTQYIEEGIVPRVICQIFNEVDKRKGEAEFSIKASFLEIYNQQIIDLLDHQKGLKYSALNNRIKENTTSIREQKDGSISIHGVVEQAVSETSEMLTLLDKGSLNRTTAATLMNDSSSRSHAIFTVFIEQHPLNQTEEGFITAKFFFVDLAGSERAKKTGASGTTLKEGIKINLGLLELGNVISALAFDKKQPQFISYRNSKLTRILQDSLGGNSNTYMIACISPAQSNYQQTLNTLKYASKAMNVKNKPIVNRDPHTAMVNQLRQRIKELQDENLKLRDLLKGQGINYEPFLYSKSQSEQQMKKMQLENTLLQRKCEKLLLDMIDQKKRKNQLQIQNYQLQRQRDILSSMVDQFKSNHPEYMYQVDQLYNKQNIPLIQNYLNKIQNMQTQLFDKQKLNNQLQIQYNRIHDINQKNQQIMINKNQTLYKLAKENKVMNMTIRQLKKEIYKLNNVDQCQQEEDQDNQLEVINQILQEEDNLELDQSFNREVQSFSRRQEKMQTQIKSVENYINQKEGILKQMAQQQMELEMTLILQMKQKYHKKIEELQEEKKHLLKQQKNQINLSTTNKLSQKIDQLQIQLRQNRVKAKQQKQIEGKVTHQSQVIKNLGNQIKNFKLQKIELNRKLKEDKECFQKFKQKRTHELMLAKKQNMKKDAQIRKLTNQNKKKSFFMLKRADQIKKVKKVNETLKKLLKPLKAATSRLSSRSDRGHEKKKQLIPIENKQLQSLVAECLRNMLLKIDRDFDLSKYSKKCEQINSELDNLVRQESGLNFKIEQLSMKEQQFDFDNIDKEIQKQSVDSKMKLNLSDLRERISNLEDNLQFCERKYAQLLQDDQTKYQYSYEASILYNQKYDNVNAFREILRAFINALHRLLIENYELRLTIEQISIRNNNYISDIQELKENIIRMTMQHQQRVTELREELMMKMYEQLYEDNHQKDQNKINQTSFPNQVVQKFNEKERKNFEKKIEELNKNNNKLIADNEMWRRKCLVVNQKYQNLRSLFNKDKFVGRTNREEENNINHPNNTASKQLRKNRDNTPAHNPSKVGNPNSNLMDQLNSMAEHLKSVRGKKQVTFNDERPQDQLDDTPVVQSRRDFNRYKWECMATIQAHSSPVLCIKSFGNIMVSSANRNIRIWDLSDNKLISDIFSPNLNYFVRSLAIHPQKQLLAAACDKLVTLWDLRQASNHGVLKGHKQEVRCLHIVDNYLFTGGKGLTNSGSLLVWDLRYINYNTPMEEKQRNQDIFSMTSHRNILFYGSRDHHVRRLNIDSLETLTTFQPPHMDTVTGLATSKGYLISGSKDKNLRLWSLDNSIYNLKSTVHASNDYINCVQSDQYHPLFYAGDRTGQVKVGSIIKEKIEFVGGFAHSQPVNTICSLSLGRCTATGSTDKSIKLWQPTSEAFHQIESNLC